MRRILPAFLKAIGVTIAVIILLGVIDLVVVQGIGRPIRWEIPLGYQGWVVVQYDNPSCPQLREDGVYLVVTVPASGRVCTSNPPPTGWSAYHYEYVSADGARRDIRTSGHGGGGEIWAGSYTPKQAQVPYPEIHFFVGPEDALEKSWGSEPRP